MKRLTPLLAITALLLNPVAHAQNELSFAPYVGYSLDTENVVIGIGLDAEIGPALGIPAPLGVSVWGDIETQLGLGDTTAFQIDLNVTPTYEIGKLEVAVGVGFALERQSFDSSSFTETGFNTLIGVKYNAGFVNPFARFRCTFFNGFDSDFRNDTLFGGLMIALGGF